MQELKKQRAGSAMLHMEKMKMSINMEHKDHKLLNNLLLEYSDDTIRRKLIAKYN